MKTASSPAKSRLSRSETMARVKSTDTTPEMIVRKAVHAAGLRCRLHRSDLPGTPDIVFPSRKVAVLVHGCFWHSHVGCPRARIPSTRRDYWVPKLARNAARDAANAEALRAAGWRVIAVWECELKDPSRLPSLIAEIRSRG